MKDMLQLHIHYGTMGQLQGHQSKRRGSISDSKVLIDLGAGGENITGALNDSSLDCVTK